LSEQVTPYGKSGASKKAEVGEMFDQIAPRYDLLNRSLTFGLDMGWRRRAIGLLRPARPRVIVDMATGTADFALAAAALRPEQIIGIDLSNQMLAIGRDKVRRAGLESLIRLEQGDSEAIALPDAVADAVTVGFGVRNFEDVGQGLREIARILRPGGTLIVLEPAYPSSFPMKQLFNFYFRVFTPLIGRLVSGDRAAYTYLPDSVRAFPFGEDFLQICRAAGFSKGRYSLLGLGACVMYVLEKP
jgi:demethylmenaquinone methyltransferase/2-methoxy-6-polyprenyl-1,4-benzoquinol methylase